MYNHTTIDKSHAYGERIGQSMHVLDFFLNTRGRLTNKDILTKVRNLSRRSPLTNLFIMTLEYLRRRMLDVVAEGNFKLFMQNGMPIESHLTSLQDNWLSETKYGRH